MKRRQLVSGAAALGALSVTACAEKSATAEPANALIKSGVGKW